MIKELLPSPYRSARTAVWAWSEFAPNVYNPKVYAFDLVTIAENSVIPDHVQIGKNTAIVGKTVPEDYPDGLLAVDRLL